MIDSSAANSQQRSASHARHATTIILQSVQISFTLPEATGEISVLGSAAFSIHGSTDSGLTAGKYKCSMTRSNDSQ